MSNLTNSIGLPGDDDSCRKSLILRLGVVLALSLLAHWAAWHHRHWFKPAFHERLKQTDSIEVSLATVPLTPPPPVAWPREAGDEKMPAKPMVPAKPKTAPFPKPRKTLVVPEPLPQKLPVKPLSQPSALPSVPAHGIQKAPEKPVIKKSSPAESLPLPSAPKLASVLPPVREVKPVPVGPKPERPRRRSVRPVEEPDPNLPVVPPEPPEPKDEEPEVEREPPTLAPEAVPRTIRKRHPVDEDDPNAWAIKKAEKPLNQKSSEVSNASDGLSSDVAALPKMENKGLPTGSGEASSLADRQLPPGVRGPTAVPRSSSTPAGAVRPGNAEPASGGGSSDAQYLKHPQPEYPSIARQRGWTGTVKLRIQILADGTVGEVEIAESSGHEILDNAALEVAREEWRFEPAKKDGKPVASYRIAPVRFSLQD